MIRRLMTPALAMSALLLTPACSSDVMQLSERTVTNVPASGGAAKSADGEVEIAFSSRALDQDTEITIATIHNHDVPRVIGPIYDFGPDGLQFGGTVLVTMTAPASDEELAIANVDGAYPEILDSSSFDPLTGTLTAELEHFSSYAVVQVYNPCGGQVCGANCTICDPLDPACVEPAPASKQCNRSGLCVDSNFVMCAPPVDAGVPDSGTSTVADAGPTPDAGSVPDSGPAADAGGLDSGIPTCTDQFTQNPQPIVDILLAVDSSCSMGQEQAALGASFPLLLNTLTQNNVDFHIGVTTVDTSPGGEQGALVGSPSVLTSTTPNLATAFANNVNVGLSGAGIETGLEASRLAMSPPLTTGANAGFLRLESSKVVIYVSDEDDQSNSSTAAYSQFLLGLGGPRRVQANAIVGPQPQGCSGAGGSASPGTRYDAVRAATGGAFDSICDASWPQALTNLGGSGFGYLYEFQLAGPAPGGILDLRVDGVSVPSAGGANWSYDPATRTITFAPSAVPAPGATIVVDSGC